MTFGSQNTNRPASYTGDDYLTEETSIHPYPLYATKRRHCCHGSDGFTVIGVCFFVLTIAITFALIIQINYGNPEVTPHGAVATDAEGCSRVGITLMKEGGSAVDVAIASILCMTVVHPHVVGPGGSGVMLVHDHKSNRSVVIDFMSDIPRNHSFDKSSEQNLEGRSIGVPGLMRGLEYAHSKFGKVPWPSLFEQSIKLAREGFYVSHHLVKALHTLNITQVDGVTPFERTFFPRGLMLEESYFMRRENYADFLETIAAHGAASFYALDFGVEEIEALRSIGSDVHVRDFDNYKVRERPCIHMNLLNRTVFTAPAPFGGPQLLSAMEMLKNSNLTQNTPSSYLYYTFSEAIRRSYAAFITLAEGDEPALQNLTEHILKSSAEVLIGSEVTPADASLPRISDQAATTVSVIDTFDQYVTSVIGLGSYFGSRVMTKHGILFNNHLANLPNTQPQTDEYSRARPLTLYTPLILTDNQKVCGQRIVLSSPDVGAAVQVISQLVFRNQNLTQAIEQPRITIKPGMDQIYLEDFGKIARLSGEVRNSFTSRNVTLIAIPEPYSSVNGISKVKDRLASWADVRGGGAAHRLESSSSR